LTKFKYILMEDNVVKLLTEILVVIGALVGGTFIVKKVITTRKNITKQKNINISGNNSKVIGGDDSSINIK